MRSSVGCSSIDRNTVGASKCYKDGSARASDRERESASAISNGRKMDMPFCQSEIMKWVKMELVCRTLQLME